MDFFEITTRVIAIGSPEIFVYWVIGEKAALIDSGTYLIGKKLVGIIPVYLDLEEFSWHLITHSHYDHIGGTPVLLDHFKVKVGAHSIIPRLLKTRKFIEHITEMNRKELERAGKRKEIVQKYRFRPFRINRLLKDNEILDLGDGVKLKVVETPGHTKDSISFIVLPEKVAITGDAAGILDKKHELILPQFLYDPIKYLKSIARLYKEDIFALCPGHETFITGYDKVKNFLKNSFEETKKYVGLIKECLDKHKEEYCQKSLFEKIYDTQNIRQPEFAFIENLKAQIRSVKIAILKYGENWLNSSL